MCPRTHLGVRLVPQDANALLAAQLALQAVVQARGVPQHRQAREQAAVQREAHVVVVGRDHAGRAAHTRRAARHLRAALSTHTAHIRRARARARTHTHKATRSTPPRPTNQYTHRPTQKANTETTKRTNKQTIKEKERQRKKPKTSSSNSSSSSRVTTGTSVNRAHDPFLHWS